MKSVNALAVACENYGLYRTARRKKKQKRPNATATAKGARS